MAGPWFLPRPGFFGKLQKQTPCLQCVKEVFPMAMDLNAKAAYIRGMMKGMEFDPTTQEGKIIVQ